ncbi:MAG: FAD-binding oxidoreductase [Pseudomonadota bacterium]
MEVICLLLAAAESVDDRIGCAFNATAWVVVTFRSLRKPGKPSVSPRRIDGVSSAPGQCNLTNTEFWIVAAISEQALPTSTDVVIIGGGIVGTAAAYFLAKQGVRVVLCEKGDIAGEQSSRNWGFVRQQGRDPAELPMVMESLRIWRRISDEIGEDVGFRQGGLLYVSDQPEHVARYESWVEIARQHQLDTRMLSGSELKARLPGTTGRWMAAMHTPSDGQAEPSKAAPAIARAAAAAGATILTRCAVRGVETAGGRISHVVTERGSIATPAAVCAAGAWSSLFAANVGIALPQLKIRGSVFRTTPGPEIADGGIWTPQVAIRRRLDGGYSIAHGGASAHDLVPDTFRYFKEFKPAYETERHRLQLRIGRRFVDELLTPRRWSAHGVSPFEKTRVLDPAPVNGVLEEAFAHLRRLFPAFENVTVIERWAGLIDVTPDALPVISEVDALPGFYFATGFSGHGFGIGPGAGKVIAEMVSGVPATIDRTPFAYDRFRQGVQIAGDL